jgi:hypothetical protein
LPLSGEVVAVRTASEKKENKENLHFSSSIADVTQADNRLMSLPCILYSCRRRVPFNQGYK